MDLLMNILHIHIMFQKYQAHGAYNENTAWTHQKVLDVQYFFKRAYYLNTFCFKSTGHIVLLMEILHGSIHMLFQKHQTYIF